MKKIRLLDYILEVEDPIGIMFVDSKPGLEQQKFAANLLEHLRFNCNLAYIYPQDKPVSSDIFTADDIVLFDEGEYFWPDNEQWDTEGFACTLTIPPDKVQNKYLGLKIHRDEFQKLYFGSFDNLYEKGLKRVW